MTGHGKDALDCIGAGCKRAADQVIVRKSDIMSLQEFVNTLLEKCPAIKISIIEDANIKKIYDLIVKNKSKLISFKGTLMVHQIVGNIYRSNRFVKKGLSCFCNSKMCIS